jgi:hypothetical protein
MISRKRYVIKTKNKRRPLKPETQAASASGGESSAQPRRPVTLPHYAPPQGQAWKTISMVVGAILLVGMGIYALASSQWARRPAPSAGTTLAMAMPSSPGRHASMPSSSNQGRSDLSPEQGFINAFGGANAGKAAAPTSPSTAASGKLVLQGKLSGSCDIGKNGLQDVQDCLERHSVGNN